MPADVIAAPTVGIWLGASYVLGRPVPVDEPYPHICQTDVIGRMTGQRLRLFGRSCAACLRQYSPKPEPAGDLPAVDPEILAAEARRLGEHEGDE